MAPAAVEILLELGALDRVVAIGDFVLWPPTIQELPRIGPYDAPNEEMLLDLEVDTLITSYSEAAGGRLERLEKLGVKVLTLKLGTYEGVFDSLLQVGRFLGTEPRAQALALAIRERLDEIRKRAAGAPRRRVLAVVGQNPLYVAGPGSYLHEIISMVGGQNVAADALAPYQLVSLEAMLERQPEIIIDISDNRPGALRGQRLGSWGDWPFLPAVKQQQVYWVDPTRLMIPGPRLPEMATLVGKLIHPEIFGSLSPEEFLPMQ